MNKKKTLLQIRIEDRNWAIENLLKKVERLKDAYKSNASDLDQIVYAVFSGARRAAGYSERVVDLRDVEKYGPTGGRDVADD
jgi:hypothetical protein